MSQKELVVQGAILECQYGFVPDILKVLTQDKHYANDKDAANKLIATNKDIGDSTLEANSFGLCKLQPTGSSYKPCQAVITQWSGAYEKITIQQNGGHPLLEDSLATCPIGGPGCISVTHTGQIGEPSHQNFENNDDELQAHVNPVMSLKTPYQKEEFDSI